MIYYSYRCKNRTYRVIKLAETARGKLKRNIDGRFLLSIKFQRSSSWQGTITRLTDQKTISFRSTLELLKIIDSALADANEVVPVLPPK